MKGTKFIESNSQRSINVKKWSKFKAHRYDFFIEFKTQIVLYVPQHSSYYRCHADAVNEE